MKKVKWNWNDLKIIFEDCVIEFLCPDCSEPVYVDTQNEPTTCECGKKYQLSVNIYELIGEHTKSE